MQNTQRFTWHFIPWSSSFLLYDSNYTCLASKTQRKEKRLREAFNKKKHFLIDIRQFGYGASFVNKKTIAKIP